MRATTEPTTKSGQSRLHLTSTEVGPAAVPRDRQARAAGPLEHPAGSGGRGVVDAVALEEAAAGLVSLEEPGDLLPQFLIVATRLGDEGVPCFRRLLHGGERAQAVGVVGAARSGKPMLRFQNMLHEMMLHYSIDLWIIHSLPA